jgi:hypothetical protein
MLLLEQKAREQYEFKAVAERRTKFHTYKLKEEKCYRIV